MNTNEQQRPYESGCACGTGHPVTLDVPMWPDTCVQRLRERLDTVLELADEWESYGPMLGVTVAKAFRFAAERGKGSSVAVSGRMPSTTDTGD